MAESFRLNDLSKIDYSPLGLEINPFPSVGIPEEVPAVTADREEVLKHFKTSLRETIFENKSTITVLSGDWGAGKSHILKYLKYKVNTELLDSDTPVMAVYLKSVGRNFKDLYLYFIDDIGREQLTNTAKQVIKKFLDDIGEEKAKDFIYDNAAKESFNLDTITMDEFLLITRYYDIFYEIQKRLKNVDTQVLNAFLYLAHPENFSIAWRWFLGESISLDERKMIKVQENIDDSRNAEMVLQGLVSIFVQAGLDTLVLLIDEFENFSLINKNQRDKYLNELRHFIDENPNKLYLVVAGTPTAYADMTEVPSALTRRLAGQEFILDKFDIKNIKELINLYILNARIKETEKIDKLLKDAQNPDLYPFTDEAIDALYERTKGNVGYIIKICKKAIFTILNKKEKTIKKDLIEDIKI